MPIVYSNTAEGAFPQTIYKTGNRVGWWIRADGMAALASIEPTDIERHERKGMRRMKEWGEGRLAPFFNPETQRVEMPISKYERLLELAREYPEAREAFRLMYTPRTPEGGTVYTCECGIEYRNEMAFEAHKFGCPKAFAAAVVAAPASTLPLPGAETEAAATPPATTAPAAAPARVYACKKEGCGAEFPSPLQVARHTKAEHAPVKRTKKKAAA